MNPSPSPHIALVTGGSRGLGANTALHIARQGQDVMLTYRSQREQALAVVQAIEALGRRAVALPLDVASGSGFGAFALSVQQALHTHWQLERFDHLINNAGTGLDASFMETSEAQFDELFNIHFKSVFFLSQTLLPLMNDGGSIVNISSGLARFTSPGKAAYGAMKGAVEVLSRYMAKELGPRGITVNVVAPGPVATDFGGGTVRDNAQVNAYLAAQTALGRVGLPDDIGGVIASLLRPENRWLNAQRLEASGGIFI